MAQTDPEEALPALETSLVSIREPRGVDVVKGAILRLREEAGEQLGSLSLAEDVGDLALVPEEVSPTDPSSG